MFTHPDIKVLVTLMVQLFYTWRIHVLTRNWLLVAVVTLVTITSAGTLRSPSHFATPDQLSGFGFIVVWETTVKVVVYTRMLEIKVSEYLELGCFELHRKEG
jgi:hypothetical protein